MGKIAREKGKAFLFPFGVLPSLLYTYFLNLFNIFVFILKQVELNVYIGLALDCVNYF